MVENIIESHQKVIDLAFENPKIKLIFERLSPGIPPNWILAGGAVFQTIWNSLSQRPAEYGIKDYDLFYFDRNNLSWEGEDQHINLINELFMDHNLEIEVKNQARVHLWYKAKFNTVIPPLKSQFEGVDGFLNINAAIGLYKIGGEVKVYAPYGLVDLFNFIVRPNPNSRTKDPKFYFAKTKRWKETWPEINVISYS